MVEGKTHVLDRHRWILPGGLVVGVGGAWLLNVWTRAMRPDILAWRAPLWEQFLPCASWALLFLVLIYIAAMSSRQRVLGGVLLGIGLCAWLLQFFVSLSWQLLYSDGFRQWVLNPYATELMFRPYNLLLGRALLWIGALLLLPTRREGTKRLHQHCRARGWVASIILLGGVIGAFAFMVRFLPAVRSGTGREAIYAWWPLHMHDFGILLVSAVTVTAWVWLSEIFRQSRWLALPWVVLGAMGIGVIAMARHPSVVRPVYDFLYRTLNGPTRFFELTANIFWIGVLGFLMGSRRQARGCANANSAAPSEMSR